MNEVIPETIEQRLNAIEWILGTLIEAKEAKEKIGTVQRYLKAGAISFSDYKHFRDNPWRPIPLDWRDGYQNRLRDLRAIVEAEDK